MQTTVRCPECHKGTITLHVIAKHKTQLGGKDIVVKNAEVGKCSNCDFIAVTAKELKRWEEQQINSYGDS